MSEGTLPLAEEALDDPEVTIVATDLAPSQIAATTVPRPPTPPECTGSQVELWTAQVVPNGDGRLNALIRVRNSGRVWCEPDIGRSPLLDPNIEPDVWLEPGQTADLWVGQMPGDCSEPALVTLVQVGIGTDSLVIPSVVVTCGWWLNAFYPNDLVTEPCTSDDLEVALTAAAVVVRSVERACRIGNVVGVTASDGLGLVEGRPASPDARDVLPGDIAVIGLSRGHDCTDPARAVTLVIDDLGELVIDDVPCDMFFWAGAVVPWIDAEHGPLGAPTAQADIDSLLESLDPFANRT